MPPPRADALCNVPAPGFVCLLRRAHHVRVDVGVHVRVGMAMCGRRGTEPISKMEFRQHIRKMLTDTDAKDIDALFDELDE